MKKRLLASLLSLVMVLAMLPTAAMATDETTGDEPPVVCAELEGCMDSTHDADCPLYVAPEETGDEPTEEPADEPNEPMVAEQLQARIDALPSAEELSAMGDEERDAAYLEAISIDDAIQELPDEEQALLGTTKLDTVFEWFNAQTAAQPEGNSEPAEEPEGEEDNPWDISADGEGNDVTAYLTVNGSNEPITYTLHIAGTGAMKDYGFGGQDLPQESSITKVEIHEGVTEIGDWAFHGIANLTEVSLPNSLERIGSSAFQGISNFSATILIGPNVTEIGENAFYSTSIAGYSLATDNHEFMVKDGILYSADGKTLISCPGGKSDAFNENWLEGVETIADYAFRGCKLLTGTVKFPASVTSIGAYAFQNCTQLQEVIIPDTVQGAIGEYTFHGCTALEEVTIGSGITTIGNNAFWNCKDIKTIDLSKATFNSIGTSAFQGCSSLTALDIPDAVTGTIGENAFSGCSALGSIAIGDGITSIGSQAFANCTKSAASGTTLTLGDSITTIADDAFSGSTNFTGNLTIPDSMTGTLGQVFRHCGFNGKLTISDGITEIAQGAFNGSKITGLDLGEGVQKIGQSAFYNTSLTGDLIIPDSVTEIGYIAFFSCEGLNGKLVLSKNLTTLGNQAFASCNFSGTVIIPDGLKTIPISAFNSTNSESYISCFVIPSSVTSIGNAALFNQYKNAVYYLEDASTANLLTNTNSNGSIAITNGGRFAESTQFGADTLATPIKDGCKFDGWYTQNGSEPSGWGEKVTGKINVSQDKTYYAKWTQVNGYDIDSGDKNVTLTMTYGDTPASTTVDVTVPTGGSISTVESSNDAIIKASIDNTTVTITAEDNLNAGTYAETVYVYTSDGSTHWINVSLTVSKAESTVNPDEDSVHITATYGDTITLTAEVEKAQANGIAMMDTARDTVDFYCGDTSLGSVRVSYTGGGTYTEGTATLIYNTSQNGIPVGTTSTITAVYGGSVNLNGSNTNSIRVTLNKINTSIDITPDRTSLTGGGTVTLTVDKSGLPDGAKVNVTCNNGITPTENTDGIWAATLPNSTQTYTFTASYTGDKIHNASSDTCTVSVTRRSNGGGGGGSTTYTVSTDAGRNGDVTVSPSRASYGDTVTITVDPDEGYELDELIVTDSDGDEISVRSRGDGRYTFTMPRGRVTVKATFVEITEDPDLLTFTDVPASAYYYDAVYWAVENGVTNGTSNTTFSPDASCTRAQMVTFLWRAAGSPEPESTVNPFTDVSASAYYYDAVLWAVEQGITNGTSATTFGPDATVTRGQTVTFLWRYDGSTAASGSGFADVASDAYYADAVAWAASEGVTSGTSATTFSPSNDCTRGQIVTFLYRYMG